uniref:Ig-like domain-containing protein n=1 Tax=Maylandia zebra TaxID=106582 RepID=A0A3P9CS25_9CICH
QCLQDPRILFLSASCRKGAYRMDEIERMAPEGGPAGVGADEESEKTKPDIVLLPEPFQSILEGEAAEFKCKLIACPPPTILWFHNNRSIPKEHRRRIYTDSKMHVHTTSLVIHGVKEKDSGSYKVMAINIEGSLIFLFPNSSCTLDLREKSDINQALLGLNW